MIYRIAKYLFFFSSWNLWHTNVSTPKNPARLPRKDGISKELYLFVWVLMKPHLPSGRISALGAAWPMVIFILLLHSTIMYALRYRVSQKKHSYKIFGLEIMLFTCSQTLWSGLRSSFTKWGTAPAFTTACKTTMSASRWRAWSLVQKFYKSVFSGTPCSCANFETFFASLNLISN